MLNQEQLDTLRAMGLSWSNEWVAEQIWINKISRDDELPRNGTIIFRRETDFPEQVNGLGPVFILLRVFLDKWIIVKSRKKPYGGLLALCLVERGPSADTEVMEITGILGNGRVKGKFVESKEVILGNVTTV